MLQFEINFNAVRGIFWLIPGAYIFIKCSKNDNDLKYLYVSFLLSTRLFDKSPLDSQIAIIVFFLLQGFVSAPLTLHISNFSISISLNSIILGIVGKLIEIKLE